MRHRYRKDRGFMNIDYNNMACIHRSSNTPRVGNQPPSFEIFLLIPTSLISTEAVSTIERIY